MHGPLAPFWPNSNRQTACFPMSAIFIFAAAHYPSAALSELRVAIRRSPHPLEATNLCSQSRTDANDAGDVRWWATLAETINPLDPSEGLTTASCHTASGSAKTRLMSACGSAPRRRDSSVEKESTDAACFWHFRVCTVAPTVPVTTRRLETPVQAFSTPRWHSGGAGPEPRLRPPLWLDVSGQTGHAGIAGMT